MIKERIWCAIFSHTQFMWMHFSNSHTKSTENKQMFEGFLIPSITNTNKDCRVLVDLLMSNTRKYRNLTIERIYWKRLLIEIRFFKWQHCFFKRLLKVFIESVAFYNQMAYSKEIKRSQNHLKTLIKRS